MCNYQAENYIDAAKFFKKTIQIEPDFPDVHFHLALTYNILGKKREVRKEMNIIYMLNQNLHSQLTLELEK